MQTLKEEDLHPDAGGPVPGYPGRAEHAPRAPARQGQRPMGENLFETMSDNVPSARGGKIQNVAGLPYLSVCLGMVCSGALESRWEGHMADGHALGGRLTQGRGA